MPRVRFILLIWAVLSAGIVSLASAPAEPEIAPEVSVVNRGLIPWSATNRLDWGDFRGTSLRKSVMVAESFTQLSYSWSCNGDSVDFTVEAHFNPHKSWVRGEPTENLLEHEQLHFDITEMFAREMRRDLSTLEMPCTYSKEAISGHYHGLLERWRETQKRYDKETNHSLIRSEQKKWENWVNEELEALETYASE